MRPPASGAAGVLLHACRDFATLVTNVSVVRPPPPGTRQPSVLKISPDACKRAPSPYPDGTWACNRGAGSLIRRPVIRSRPGTTRVPRSIRPGISGLCGYSVSAPSVAWFVDLAPTMWARCGRRKEAEPLPAVRALHLPREDLSERPRSHQVTAGAFRQRRAPAALVPRWPSQDADVVRAGSGARESRSSRSQADAAPARGLRPSRPDQMLRPR